MKHFSLFVALCATVFVAQAQNIIESFNMVSDRYMEDIQDVKIVRSINGGTVVVPLFDESCPQEIKAPFSYACKIVEEYMPPCLPLKIKVSCGRIGGSKKNAVSKVLARTKERFGKNPSFNNVQMSVIKGVILSEFCHNSTVTYLDSVPDVEFLVHNPDIEIVYNVQRLNEMSFSLEPTPGQKFDFVSLVIRDIFIGLGLSSSFRLNPITEELLNPSHELTPFEKFIDNVLGNNGDPTTRLEEATKGELLLRDNNLRALRLYAPSPWQNGISLNFFVPQEDCNISDVLAFDFCKGKVSRSLSDDYSNFIFRDLLGWQPNFVSSTSSSSIASEGSTSFLMPYNGSASFSNRELDINSELSYNQKLSSTKFCCDNEELYNYVGAFHPFLANGNVNNNEGTSVSVLKKDGSWDLVRYLDFYSPDLKINMSDLQFSFSEEHYARTIDGYLRARITTKRIDNFGRTFYNSKFFVIDFLPQKVQLSYSIIKSSDETKPVSSQNTVRIYFSNTEGIDRLVVEKLRKGSRIPNKSEIIDFKKGYFETLIDGVTTFTAVGYNENGISRGLPITVDSNSESSNLSLSYEFVEGGIYVDSLEQSEKEYIYTINPIETNLFSKNSLNGKTSGFIDTSALPKGIYVLKVLEERTGLFDSIKFQK